MDVGEKKSLSDRCMILEEENSLLKKEISILKQEQHKYVRSGIFTDNEEITFEKIFSIDEIQRVQQAFAEATGVASIITGVDGKPITEPSNFCRLCSEIIRKTKHGRANCYHSDSIVGKDNESGPIVQPCLSGGLWDGGASIRVGNKHIANWLIGQVRTSCDDDEKMMQYAREIGADEEEFREALKEVTIMTEEQFRKVADMLFLVANLISRNAYSIYMLLKEKRLREESERVIESLMNNLPGMAYRCKNNVSWDMEFISNGCVALTGYDPKEFYSGGKLAYADIIHPGDQQFVWETIQQAIENFSYYTIRYRIITKDQNLKHVWEKGNGVFNESGRLLFLEGIIEDISDLVRAEQEREKIIAELEKKNSELERFTYTVSHDLKAPLVTVKGFLGMFERDIESNDQDAAKDDIKEIATATDKMSLLLNDLLEFSRVGRTSSFRESVSWTEIANETIEYLNLPTLNKNLKISVEPDMGFISGERVRLIEIMQNLIVNSIKYMGAQDKPQIKIYMHNDECCVEDNGIGIPPEYHEKIFGLFNKLDADTEGTGVGLAIVKRIVETHNGEIRVQSDGRNHGTKIFVKLPLVSQNDVEMKGTL